VIVEKREDGKVETEATIKIWVDGERYVRTAEGNGPVNALDRRCATRSARLHPHLRDIELVNYKVRILDEHHGTGAVTRVLLDSSDGVRHVGHDRRAENVIEASAGRRWSTRSRPACYGRDRRSGAPVRKSA
jgi:2-isopropylmalate synthase